MTTPGYCHRNFWVVDTDMMDRDLVMMDHHAFMTKSTTRLVLLS